MDVLEAFVARARSDPDVNAALLFGSTARGETEPGDIDVALVLASGADESEAEIRYSGDEQLDVSAFARLPPHVRARVLRDARVLFVKDEDALYDAAFEALAEYEDTRAFYEEYLEGAGRA